VVWVAVAEAVVAAARVVVGVRGRAGWAAPRRLVLAAIASAPTVGTERRTLLVSLVTKCNAPSAAQR
jgi:hypothetical protein